LKDLIPSADVHGTVGKLEAKEVIGREGKEGRERKGKDIMEKCSTANSSKIERSKSSMICIMICIVQRTTVE
jgi:hypothetical protein